MPPSPRLMFFTPRHRRFHAFIVLCLCLIIPLPSTTIAQDSPEQPDEITLPLLRYGQVITGSIGNNEPRVVYALEALRCDFVSVRVRATGGDLDPVMLIVADDGQAIFARDDANGTQDILFEPLAIPRTGRYEVVVGRFGYGLGTTSGNFELEINRIGNGSNPNCAMRYGDTVFYAITQEEPEVIYSFRGQQGDIISVTMQRRSGDLDAYIKIVDSFGVILDFNDDRIGGNTKDAAIDAFVVPEDGTYFIFATRYGQRSGPSTGNFSLSLREGQFSGLGNTAQAALSINYDATVDGELSNAQPVRYYRFQARQNDLITVEMTRSGGNLDSFLVIANASLQELVENDDANPSTQNAAIVDWLVPADGTYYIIATRLQREAGTTTGGYRLSLRNAGNAFADVPANVRRVRYGTSITGTIDDVTPTIQYAFFGEAGDTVRVTMDRSSGNLDPLIVLRNATGTALVSDDDGGIDRNARLDRFTLPASGVYIVEATRAEGDNSGGTAGNFLLVLAQLFD